MKHCEEFEGAPVVVALPAAPLDAALPVDPMELAEAPVVTLAEGEGDTMELPLSVEVGVADEVSVAESMVEALPFTEGSSPPPPCLVPGAHSTR